MLPYVTLIFSMVGNTPPHTTACGAPPGLKRYFQLFWRVQSLDAGHVSAVNLKEVLEDASTLYLIYEPLQPKALSRLLRQDHVGTCLHPGSCQWCFK